MPIVWPGPPDTPENIDEGFLHRAWRELWPRLNLFPFGVAAAILGTVAGVVTFQHANDSQNSPMVRAVLTSGASLVGILAAVVLLFIGLAVYVPFKQRDEARAEWGAHYDQWLAQERGRFRQPQLSFAELKPLVRREIAVGKELLARWPSTPSQAEFYELYTEADHWVRAVSEVMDRAHLDWRAYVFEDRPFLRKVSPFDAGTVRQWIEESVGRLQELLGERESRV